MVYSWSSFPWPPCPPDELAIPIISPKEGRAFPHCKGELHYTCTSPVGHGGGVPPVPHVAAMRARAHVVDVAGPLWQGPSRHAQQCKAN